MVKETATVCGRGLLARIASNILCSGKDATNLVICTGWFRMSARIWYIDKVVACAEVGGTPRIAVSTVADPTRSQRRRFAKKAGREEVETYRSTNC